VREMQRRRFGQILLVVFVLVIMIVALAIITWLGLTDAKILGGFFVIILILIGAGASISKKK
jgi:hypothetical protein